MPARHNVRTQSAMEYLMTYGWAILIIAVVLGALYSLGVFNTSSLQPKVPGGGCHVFRPNGPGTSWNVNLVGSCNNALPQYVAQFNGQSSYVSGRFSIGNTIAIGMWLKSAAYNHMMPYSEVSTAYSSNGPDIFFQNKVISWNTNDATSNQFSNSSNLDSNWHHVAIIDDYSTNLAKLYIDGRFIGSAAYRNPAVSSNSLFIGAYGNNIAGYIFNGSIANVQIYNISLTANQVKYLYNEGIGGVPISPQYLVGWWPLNGDADDYSGNGNNGVPTAITYNGSWTSGYNH